MLDPAEIRLRQDSTRLLTKNEEVLLAKRIERGDLGAKDEMILRNQRLVYSLANSKHAALWRPGQPPRCDKEDLISHGYIGLIRAVEKFDWRRGCRFSTYAHPWIKEAIDKGLKDGDTIQLPHEVRHLRMKLKRLRAERPAEIPVAEYDRLLIEEAGLPVSRMEAALNAPRAAVNLEDEIPGTEGLTYASAVGTKEPDPDRLFELAEVGRINRETLERLAPDEASVIRLRMGIDRGEQHSLRQTAEKLGLPVETVRRLEAEAMARLATQQAA